MNSVLVYASDPALMPSYATKGSSGMDLHAAVASRREVLPGSRWNVRTGVHLVLRPGLEAQVRGRSGLRRDHGIMVPIGSIDSDYRGEIKIDLFNLGSQPWHVNPGDRIAQLVISPVLTPQMSGPPLSVVSWQFTTDEDEFRSHPLYETARGDGGYGSTGR